MAIRIFLFCLLSGLYAQASGQCFISSPLQVCAGDCGPVFYLTSDPPGTTYAWTIGCGTISNPTMANPHTACFMTPGVCRIDVVVNRPGQSPDTCTTFTSVMPTTTASLAEIICQGDSVEVNGTYYTAGTYRDTIFGGNMYGCDSFLVILVAEIPPVLSTINTIFCSGSGDSIIVHGTTYNETNPSGIEHVIGTSGCVEMIITVDLMYALPDSTLVMYTGCQGDGYSIDVGTSTYDESHPMGVDTLTDIHGCDSIITTMLTFNPVYFDTISYIGCTGDSFSITFDSIVYNESHPTGMDTFTALNGCDSIFFINLIFMPPLRDTITYEGCMGDGYNIVVLDSVFNEMNPTGTVIIPTSGCDSIVFVDLHFVDCPDSLVVTGHEVCVSGMGSQYTWYTCYGDTLPDTTQCIMLGDTGCICVSFTDGTGFDTLCMTYNLCELTCHILAPDTVCIGDSVFVSFVSNDSSLGTIQWEVMLDGNISMSYSDTNSFWLVYYSPGCYTIQLELQDSGCITSCIDSICVFSKPLGNVCCDRVECDSCATLVISLIGNPPFTIAISDGASVDTVSGINSSVYNYLACPPYDKATIFTLLWVHDSTSVCDGSIINANVSVYLEQRPPATISVSGDTLCGNPQGYAYNWVDCQNTTNVSFDRCFVPSSSGCYCVYISTLLTDCVDSACIDFIKTDVHVNQKSENPVMWYDAGQKSIFIKNINFSAGSYAILLSDIQGRRIPFQSLTIVDNDEMRIKLLENTPSWIAVSIITAEAQSTKAIYIPGY